jgi:3D-(3,5/4)-trihydroxycyclohexane-1,2-dione acylhydrolase (decyclizing)
VTCLAEALEGVRGRAADLAGAERAVDGARRHRYAKARRRRQIMVCTASIGPGALNMITAAGVAHANRLPVLMLAGDTFANRRPDPVLQQVEHFGNPTITANDAFRAVTRCGTASRIPSRSCPRCRRPSPPCSTRRLRPGLPVPAAGRPGDGCDYPAAFFEPTLHDIPRPRPDRGRLAAAADLLRTAKRRS